MKDNLTQTFDVIVIGGGPSGMMAAGRAAELGASVLLLEKNESLGKKLRITGGGRCNITNETYDVRVLTEKYGKKGKFLFPAFSRFDVAATLEFFHTRGLPTVTEAENRVFPASFRADDVWGVMVQYIFENKVAIYYNTDIEGLLVENKMVVGVRMHGQSVRARKVIVATGGSSRPETGSTGDGFRWLQDIGHMLTEPDRALVPVTIQDPWVKSLQGMSLQHAKLSIVHRGKKVKGMEGKLLFTHFGISGPLVLNMSRDIREYFTKRKTQLSLDIFPNTERSILDEKLLKIISEKSNTKVKNALKEFVTPAIVDVLCDLAHINGEKYAREMTRSERQICIDSVKDMRMTPSGFLGMDKAVVSSGGVDVREVDFKTMQSRLYPSLYLVGDILDFNRPSGGYSLQICWTTGRLAGESAVKSLM